MSALVEILQRHLEQCQGLAEFPSLSQGGALGGRAHRSAGKGPLGRDRDCPTENAVALRETFAGGRVPAMSMRPSAAMVCMPAVTAHRRLPGRLLRLRQTPPSRSGRCHAGTPRAAPAPAGRPVLLAVRPRLPHGSCRRSAPRHPVSRSAEGAPGSALPRSTRAHRDGRPRRRPAGRRPAANLSEHRSQLQEPGRELIIQSGRALIAVARSRQLARRLIRAPQVDP